MSRQVTQIKYLSMLLIKSCRSRAEAQSLQPLTDKVTTPYQRNILERNIKLRKNKPRFAQEVHLPRATLVVPDEVFVRQEIQTMRPAGEGEWLPLLHPLPLILCDKGNNVSLFKGATDHTFFEDDIWSSRTNYIKYFVSITLIESFISQTTTNS